MKIILLSVVFLAGCLVYDPIPCQTVELSSKFIIFMESHGKWPCFHNNHRLTRVIKDPRVGYEVELLDDRALCVCEP